MGESTSSTLERVAPPAAGPKPGSIADATARGPGFRAAQWRMLLAVMLCYLFYYTGRQNMGFAIPALRDMGLSYEQCAWFGTVLLWCYGLGQIVNGNLGDVFGSRRMMTLGAVLSTVLNWVTGFGNSFLTILLLERLRSGALARRETADARELVRKAIYGVAAGLRTTG